MITIIILIAIYLLGALAWWYAIKLLYTYKWENINPDSIDVFIMFIPILNLIWGIIGLIVGLSSKYNKDDKSKFFNIKR